MNASMEQPHKLPDIELPPNGMDLDDLMDVTARLADVLEEETTYLRSMQMDALAKLHEKKMQLVLLLEGYKRLLKQQPDLLKSADEAKLSEFTTLSDELTAIVEENFRRTMVARAVNKRVVDTIIETVSEQNRPPTYNKYGNSSLKQDLSMSFNLNQRA